MEVIEDAVEKAVNTAIDKLDIDLVMESPSDAMDEMASLIKEIIMDFADEAAGNGLEFANKIQALNRDIKIADSNDPHLNEG